MLGLWGKAPLASAQAPLPCPVGSAIEAERERGRVARGALRDEEALTIFTNLYGCTLAPEDRARQGITEGALQRWAEAETHLRESLARGDDPWIARNRGVLEGALRAAQERLGRAAQPAAQIPTDAHRHDDVTPGPPRVQEQSDQTAAARGRPPGRSVFARWWFWTGVALLVGAAVLGGVLLASEEQPLYQGTWGSATAPLGIAF
jgi:hypothetical protein